ncbi:MAG: PQQ-binding-like beta-propeller repeat protein [bacterium]
MYKLLVTFLLVISLLKFAAADQKTIVIDDIPKSYGGFTVSPDGSRLFFAASKFLVFDATGKLVDQIGTPNAANPRVIVPTADGWYISITSYAAGHVALVRPDGTEAKTLVSKGSGLKNPHYDSTGWTSPTGGAIDTTNKRIFLIDTTVAPRDDRKIPDPDWTRVIMYDFDGNYIRDFNHYDAYAADAKANDAQRTWYRDIAFDPTRKLLYMAAVASKELQCCDYDGNFVNKVKVPFGSEFGGVAVFPDGRVAVSTGRDITIYNQDLTVNTTVAIPKEIQQSNLYGLETDANGKLYASMNDSSVTFVRWLADLQTAEVIGPRYQKINVDFPDPALTAGKAFNVKASIVGRPLPDNMNQWQVIARSSDGSNLRWKKWTANFKDGSLEVIPPVDIQGIYDVAVRFGDGPIDWSNRDSDLYIQKTVALLPAGAVKSLAIVTTNGRQAFRQGETVALRLIQRSPDANEEVEAMLQLQSIPASKTAIREEKIKVKGSSSLEIPADFTRRLAPGSYILTPIFAGYTSYPLTIDISSNQVDSPMQRIMYHEFGGNVFDDTNNLADNAEKMNLIQNWTTAVKRLGFTRETIRDSSQPNAWRHDAAPANLANPGFAPAEYYRTSQGGWTMQYYLDRATDKGINVDLQIIGHCGAVRCSDQSLNELDAVLQKQTQSYSSYPSFYGFNYNDEMFVNSPYGGLQQSDKDFYNKAKEEKFKGRPTAEVGEYIMDVMYDSFNTAVKQANLAMKTTAAPMWQFPAVESSYAPSIYKGMSESYAHFLSEGYSVPWYPAQSVEMLRRPGKPIMGVFDNLYDSKMAGERYLKNAMQILARGVQGVGAQHTSPFLDINGASAYKTANKLAMMYGPVFAEFPTANEGAILYSKTQDYTETRNGMGTPQWERAFELMATGLMAGVPMNIVYEEDVAAGWLLDGKKPRVPMFFLVGMNQRLPANVEDALKKYVAAGGKLFEDSATEYGVGDWTKDVTVKDPEAFLRKIRERQTEKVRNPFMRLGSGVNVVVKNLKDWNYPAEPAPQKVLDKVPELLEWLINWNDLYDANDFKDTQLSDTTKKLLEGGYAGLLKNDRRNINANILLDLYPGIVVAKEKAKEINLGQVKLNLNTYQLRTAWGEGYAADSLQPLMQPIMEKEAAELKTLVGANRRFPVDTDDPWVSKNIFDGGDVKYLMLATETSPYPWDAGRVWFAGDMYNKNCNAWLPKTVKVTIPATTGVIYDVFDHNVITVTKSSQFTADMTAFPGRLYAISSKAIATPQLTALQSGNEIEYQVRLSLAARVPLRIRLINGETAMEEIYRGTDVKGLLNGKMTVPINGVEYKLEVTELLGGKSTAAAIKAVADNTSSILASNSINIQHEQQIHKILKDAGGVILVAAANDKMVSNEQQQALGKALLKYGITLKAGPTAPKDPTPGVLLTMGFTGSMGDVMNKAIGSGLFENIVTANVPGPGNGFITTLYSPRLYGENAIALVGGDAAGLNAAIDSFIIWLDGEKLQTISVKPALTQPIISGRPSTGFTLEKLSENIGVRLTGVKSSADGKHILVTAEGYLNNLLLVEEINNQPKADRAARIGQAYRINSAKVSPDGKWFGAAGRSINRYGQAFQMVDAVGGTQDIFTGYGDIGRQSNLFAASSDGSVVLTPGTFGVVCWRKKGNEWKEAWSIDYWKEFAKLDWPVSNSAERVPQFQTVIPDGADYALILFNEFSQNGWITPENTNSCWLAAVNLSDGKERWHFDVPISKTQLFPTLFTSPNGKRVLLQMQMGGWGKETFRLFSVLDGKSLAWWDSKTAPSTAAVADSNGRIAAAFYNRLLEIRDADGKLLFNTLWQNQPASLTFSADGQLLYVADDSGCLTCISVDGTEQWHSDLGCVSYISVTKDRIYAAGWDGRLRSLSLDGKANWIFDCTSAMTAANPMAMVAESAKNTGGKLHEAIRPPTSSAEIPTGENLLATAAAKLTVGGTGGWMSGGTVQVKAEDLTNGKLDDVVTPWLNIDELFWDGQAGRQVYADIVFAQPTDVSALTVYENSKFPGSWPTESRIQVWNEANKSWDTAAAGLFLNSGVNTYNLNLKAVTKLRYLPWNSYYRNFYTSEIAVFGVKK